MYVAGYPETGLAVATRKPMRALLVVNPAAGKRTAGPDDLEKAVALLREADFMIEQVETTQELGSAELARRAIREKFDVCIVAGGDGTVAPAAAVLMDTAVVLGILPFGSFMNIANGLGIPLVPLDAARVIARRSVHRADVGEVNGALFFETAGVGLDAELFGAARHAERGSWRRALRRVWRYMRHGTHRVSITVGDKTHAHRVMQILIVNSPYYAWALPLLPEASMEDGLLDVAVFPRMGRLALLRSLVTVMRRRRLPQKPVRYRGARLKIESAVPLSIHADGVSAGALPSEFNCRAGALRVFA